MSILEIIATMRMYGSGYVSGLVRIDSDRDSYTCSVQLTCLVITSIVSGIGFLFINQMSDLTGLSRKLMGLMFLSFYPTSVIGIWSAKQRVENKYKLMVLVTVLYSVLTPAASIAATVLRPDKLDAAIEFRVGTECLVALPFLISNLFGANKRVVFRYCREIFLFCLPLVPYYLSMSLLNSSDRIMIKVLVGDRQAAIYSVAYSLAWAMFVFEGALHMAFEPWLLGRIKKNEGEGVEKAVTQATVFLAGLNFIILNASPELIVIIASEKYAEAAWAMPPVIASLLVLFVYQQIMQVHIFYGENRIVLIGSVASAVLNIVLNLICIPRFGYIAAGYTTLASYLLIAALYYISMVRAAEKHGLDYRKFYNIRDIVTVFVVYCIMSAFVMLLYPHPLARYFLIVLMLAILIRYRRIIMGIFMREH